MGKCHVSGASTSELLPWTPNLAFVKGPQFEYLSRMCSVGMPFTIRSNRMVNLVLTLADKGLGLPPMSLPMRWAIRSIMAEDNLLENSSSRRPLRSRILSLH